MKKRLLSFLLFSALTASAQPPRHIDLDLNGSWEYGLDRNYTAQTLVPGIPLDATRPTEGRLWYRREITLPQGAWSDAVLELKGARFQPAVYLNGRLVSQQGGGMIRSMHTLRHEALQPGGHITLEISLASLADVPSSDASFIPKVDQWRSNCSSSLWDDVVLHLYAGARTERLLVDCDPTTHHATFRYRICGTNATSARITIADSQQSILTLTGSASEGENEVRFDYTDRLQEWSPTHPALYDLRVELLDQEGETLSCWQQALGLRQAAVCNKQITLNGKPLKLRGGTVVWHRWMRDAEGREVGYDSLWFRENIVRRLKEHGANFLRFHLGVPPERLLTLCDRYGLVVQYEWNFFHGMPASRESLLEQYPKWFDLAARHPSVVLYHPYNETEGDQLKTVWSALDEIVKAYPPLLLEDRDITHIHKYWWSLFENLGLYYDSYDQFDKAILVDEFGGNYLDGNGDMGGYPAIRESYMRFLGRDHTSAKRLHHLDRSCGKVAEYWRRIGAAGIAPFAIASSYADGNHWFLGSLLEGNPKSVWDALTVLWSPQAVSINSWNCNFTPRQQITLPLHFFNDTDLHCTLSARVEIIDASTQRSIATTVECRMEPFAQRVAQCPITMPDKCGDYTLRATLLNPTEEVKYPVISEWDVRVFRAQIPASVARAAVYIPTQESELLALARHLRLKVVPSPNDADVLLLGRDSWLKIADWNPIIENAIDRGTGVVMLDIGERNLGQGYPSQRGELGPLQGVTRITNPKITHYDLFKGLSLTCTEAAEPESHLHPDVDHPELWHNLQPQHTALWNGLRGGLIVPAADFEVQGLSREAFSAQWSRRGAEIAQMEHGAYYAYELCGFFAYDSLPDNKEVIRELRRKVEFLVEDAPALALSINPKAPIQVTDLGAAYRTSAKGCATELVPLASAGKNLTRTPALRIGFGAGKGCLCLSGLLTAERLDREHHPQSSSYPAIYDEVAAQFVINMIYSTLTNSDKNQ